MPWFITALLAGLISIGVLVFSRTQPRSASLPTPNGYDSIAKASALVVEVQDGYRALPELELRQIVASNTPALELLRTGLRQECRVPLEFSNDYIAKHLAQLGGIKRLALALEAEGKVAEMDGDTNRAARSYLDAIRLGHEAGRDGLLIDALVGRSCEAIGAAPLEKTVSSLEAKDCRWLIQQLEAIEARRQPAEETARIERKWSRETYGFFMLLRATIAARAWNPIAGAYQNYVRRARAASARNAQLLIALATRTFELENGRSPTNVSELVPAYLSTLPGSNTTNVLRAGETGP